MAEELPTLSIVIPAYNGACDLERCLDAVFKSDMSSVEVIVVNDGSDDPAVDQVIEKFDAIHVRSDTNMGRGPARNLGAERASGTFVLFLDADVEVSPQTIGQVKAIVSRRPNIESFFGSYDDAPDCKKTVSQYRNLLHHYTHQTGPTFAPHFWTGCGVVRKDIFHRVGGFDRGQWARNMEEVEFGHRLKQDGHPIEVVKSLMVKHLKSYTLTSMIKSDLIDRAIPWTMFMRTFKQSGNQFVTSDRQKWSAVAVLMLLSIVMAPFFGASAVWLSLGGLALFIALNLPFFLFCHRLKGPLFALQAVPLHVVHIFCAGLGFGIGTAKYWMKRLLGNNHSQEHQPPADTKINQFVSKESDL